VGATGAPGAGRSRTPAATGRAASATVGRERERGRRGGRAEAGQAGLAAGPRNGAAAQ
jgi:hypothetical protein